MTAARTWFLTSATAAFHWDRSGASLKKYVSKGLFLELFSRIVAIIAAKFQGEVPIETRRPRWRESLDMGGRSIRFREAGDFTSSSAIEFARVFNSLHETPPF
jgi:hypothetical protein